MTTLEKSFIPGISIENLVGVADALLGWTLQRWVCRYCRSSGDWEHIAPSSDCDVRTEALLRILDRAYKHRHGLQYGIPRCRS